MLGKKMGKLSQLMSFFFKGDIQGKIGTFNFKDKKVSQKLNIYKVGKNKFTKF